MEDKQDSLSRLMQCEMNEWKTEDSSKLSAQLHGRLKMLFLRGHRLTDCLDDGLRTLYCRA